MKHRMVCTFERPHDDKRVACQQRYFLYDTIKVLYEMKMKWNMKYDILRQGYGWYSWWISNRAWIQSSRSMDPSVFSWTWRRPLQVLRFCYFFTIPYFYPLFLSKVWIIQSKNQSRMNSTYDCKVVCDGGYIDLQVLPSSLRPDTFFFLLMRLQCLNEHWLMILLDIWPIFDLWGIQSKMSSSCTTSSLGDYIFLHLKFYTCWAFW